MKDGWSRAKKNNGPCSCGRYRGRASVWCSCSARRKSDGSSNRAPGSIDSKLTSLGTSTVPVSGVLVVALTYPSPPLPPLTSQNVHR